MVPPRPWTLDTLARLGVGVLLCVLLGVMLVGGTRYDPGSAQVAAHWFFLLIGGGTVALLAALVVVLREWRVEALATQLALLLVLVFVGLNLGLIAAKLGGSARGTSPRFIQILIATLAFQGASLGLVAWFLRRNAMRWRHAFGLDRAPGSALLQGVLLGVLSLPVLGILQQQCALLLRRVGWEPNPQTMVEVFREMDSLPGRLYLAFAALLLAPVTEEILFRGLLYPALKQHTGHGTAMIIASLVFAAMHANAASFVPLVVLAVALAWLYDKTENLVAPMAAHATFNTGNIVLLVLQGLGIYPK
jgi:membrane protease YdiL (CAAX protease family)